MEIIYRKSVHSGGDKVLAHFNRRGIISLTGSLAPEYKRFFCLVVGHNCYSSKKGKWVLRFLRKLMGVVGEYHSFPSNVIHIPSLIFVPNMCISMKHLYITT